MNLSGVCGFTFFQTTVAEPWFVAIELVALLFRRCCCFVPWVELWAFIAVRTTPIMVLTSAAKSVVLSATLAVKWDQAARGQSANTDKGGNKIKAFFLRRKLFLFHLPSKFLLSSASFGKITAPRDLVVYGCEILPPYQFADSIKQLHFCGRNNSTKSWN